MKPVLQQLLFLVGILLGVAVHSAANPSPSHPRRMLAPGLSATDADGNSTIAFYNIITLPQRVGCPVGVDCTLGAAREFFAQALVENCHAAKTGSLPAGRSAQRAR